MSTRYSDMLPTARASDTIDVQEQYLQQQLRAWQTLVNMARREAKRAEQVLYEYREAKQGQEAA